MSVSTDLEKGLIGVTDVPSLSFYMVMRCSQYYLAITW